MTKVPHVRCLFSSLATIEKCRPRKYRRDNESCNSFNYWSKVHGQIYRSSLALVKSTVACYTQLLQTDGKQHTHRTQTIPAACRKRKVAGRLPVLAVETLVRQCLAQQKAPR